MKYLQIVILIVSIIILKDYYSRQLESNMINSVKTKYKKDIYKDMFGFGYNIGLIQCEHIIRTQLE